MGRSGGSMPRWGGGGGGGGGRGSRGDRTEDTESNAPESQTSPPLLLLLLLPPEGERRTRSLADNRSRMSRSFPYEADGDPTHPPSPSPLLLSLVLSPARLLPLPLLLLLLWVHCQASAWGLGTREGLWRGARRREEPTTRTTDRQRHPFPSSIEPHSSVSPKLQSASILSLPSSLSHSLCELTLLHIIPPTHAIPRMCSERSTTRQEGGPAAADCSIRNGMISGIHRSRSAGHHTGSSGRCLRVRRVPPWPHHLLHLRLREAASNDRGGYEGERRNKYEKEERKSCRAEEKERNKNRRERED